MRTLLFGILSLLIGLSMAGTVAAQDSTPAVEHAGPPSGFPVAIHEGNCDDLTPEPAFEIGDAVSPAVVGENVETVGQQARGVLLTATAILDTTIEDLSSQNHVVAVHFAPDQYETIMACGRIAGVVDDGQLEIAVPPTGDSTIVGVAHFDSDASDALGLEEGQVQATVYVFDVDTGE